MTSASLPPVIAIGAIHYDTIAHARETIRPETSTPARFTAKPGGVATNLARSLVRLGVPVRLVGTVGDDGAAAILRRQLLGEGLALSVVERAGFATGQYLALHNPEGDLAAACVDDRVLSEAPSDLFDAVLEAIAGDVPEGAIWFLDANLPEEMLVRVASRIGTGRVMANAVSDAKAPRLQPVLSRLDCLMLNRGEAASLTGLPQESDPEDLAEALGRTGLKSFVLTSGSKDVLLCHDGELHRLPTRVSEIVDVTGAGDALCAGTVAALVRGAALPDAVPFGLAAAALTLRTTGALARDLSWDALAQI
ncbi:PfkB family carbohydrate kinase [Roseibium sp. M-1]